MAKAKYRYNPHTLSYDKIELTLRDRIIRAFMFLGAGLIIGIGIYFITDTYVDSPKEKQLKKILESKGKQLTVDKIPAIEPKEIQLTTNKIPKQYQRSVSTQNVPLPTTPEHDVVAPPVRSRKSSSERGQYISRYNALTVLDATIRDGLKDNLRALITTKQVQPEQALEVALTRDQLTGNHIAIVDFLIKNEFIDMSTFVTAETLERIYDKVRWYTTASIISSVISFIYLYSYSNWISVTGLRKFD